MYAMRRQSNVWSDALDRARVCFGAALVAIETSVGDAIARVRAKDPSHATNKDRAKTYPVCDGSRNAQPRSDVEQVEARFAYPYHRGYPRPRRAHPKPREFLMKRSLIVGAPMLALVFAATLSPGVGPNHVALARWTARQLNPVNIGR